MLWARRAPPIQSLTELNAQRNRNQWVLPSEQDQIGPGQSRSAGKLSTSFAASGTTTSRFKQIASRLHLDPAVPWDKLPRPCRFPILSAWPLAWFHPFASSLARCRCASGACPISSCLRSIWGRTVSIAVELEAVVDWQERYSSDIMDLNPATVTGSAPEESTEVSSRRRSHSAQDQTSPSRPSSGAQGGSRPRKSASTCSTCRFRKVRCNGSRPVCSNCQRLGFPCSYDDAVVDTWSMALPRRRAKQACLSCHSRKARCSGHLPACDRCRTQGIECVYRPGKRVRGPFGRNNRGEHRSPHSLDGDDQGRLDGQDESGTPLTDLTNTPSAFHYDV